MVFYARLVFSGILALNVLLYILVFWSYTQLVDVLYVINSLFLLGALLVLLIKTRSKFFGYGLATSVILTISSLGALIYWMLVIKDW